MIFFRIRTCCFFSSRQPFARVSHTPSIADTSSPHSHRFIVYCCLVALGQTNSSMAVKSTKGFMDKLDIFLCASCNALSIQAHWQRCGNGCVSGHKVVSVWKKEWMNRLWRTILNNCTANTLIIVQKIFILYVPNTYFNSWHVIYLTTQFWNCVTRKCST